MTPIRLGGDVQVTRLGAPPAEGVECLLLRLWVDRVPFGNGVFEHRSGDTDRVEQSGFSDNRGRGWSS